MRKSVLVFLPLTLLLLVLTLFGCGFPLASPGGNQAELQSRRIVSKVFDSSLGATHEKGVLGPGAEYEIWVPNGWAAGPRGLVMYVHGYVTPGTSIALPDGQLHDAVLPLLLGQGFAVAYSSFSQNGWAVKDGAIRTRQLRGYVEGDYGPPSKVFLIGPSEGGIITLMLAEKNPDLFSGALAICGVVGGAKMQMRYIFDQRVLFDYFFRTTLKALAAGDSTAAQLDKALGDGPLAASPAGTDLPPDVTQFIGEAGPTIGAVLSAGPPTDPLALARAMATMTVDRKPLYNWTQKMLGDGSFAPELVITISTALWYNIFGTADLLGRTHEDVPIDNTTAVYASPLLSDSANALLNGKDGVERLASSPDGSNYLEHWYQPTGRLAIPLVTLHTTRDPAVPISHEYALAQIEGKASLAEFQVDTFGHVPIDNPAFMAQVQSAFAYLQVWVASGLKPNPQIFDPPLSPLP